MRRATQSALRRLRHGQRSVDAVLEPVRLTVGRRRIRPGGNSSTPAPTRAEPIAERRLVSVLFADLVGFTALSEARDSEEVRELLSRYFELARTLIARYGGTVEKFIGDAVMAVWGTPVATEDDAERAVRAALDLVAVGPGARIRRCRRGRAC